MDELTDYEVYEVIDTLTEQKKKNRAVEAILITSVAAVGTVAAGFAIKKWGLAKLLGGVAVPFMVKDTIEAFEQSRDRTVRYMQEHKNGKHYIKLN